ncbi:DoxX family protein [Salinigranum rubrum]|uniref:DoxX family protein n=1 Tax=Salinigranum rubrum TaxID=755307 RepID=A0A2I8VMH0_9EURY|nr:DoxX family protein [Salinigranum rubrum]AUV82289.1 DoxX family protein [Salinigranum rubrum]
MDSPRTRLAGTTTLLTVVLSATVAVPVRAHVQYVTPGGDEMDPLGFLVSTLAEPVNAALLAGGAAVGVAAVLAYLRIRPLRHDVLLLRQLLAGYRDLLPWLLRLSVGLPLVGAGFAGYLFTPAFAPASPTLVRLFGITVGFCLLFGFGTRLMAAFGFVVYLAALAVSSDLLLAFEYVPGFLAIALVGGGRPSADQVVARMADDGRTFYSRIDPFYRRVAVPFVERVDGFREYVPLVLRAGVGVAFVYLGVVQKLANPGDSLAVVAKYDLTAVVPVDPALWVVGAGLVEAAVGMALLAGVFTRLFSGVAFVLLTTTLFGLPDDPVVAHISLFGLVSALLVTGAGPLSFDAWAAREVPDAVPDPLEESPSAAD